MTENTIICISICTALSPTFFYLIYIFIKITFDPYCFELKKLHKIEKKLTKMAIEEEKLKYEKNLILKDLEKK